MLQGRVSECERLDRLVEGARMGQSQALVIRGEAGIGKTALLDHLRERAAGCRIAQAVGVESEMELAFAGLHQLCAPMLGQLSRLPSLQGDALATAFGQRTGNPPDRFLVALAVLSLIAETAEDEPLICLVDDAQWLDQVSAQTLAFVARRLCAERVALVFAVREPNDDRDLAGLPELTIGGLNDTDAGELLDSVIKGPLDRRVRNRIIAETHGNPLALLELPRAWTTAELVDGFDEPNATPLAGRIADGFQRRLEALPVETRRLLLVAAAESLGDATLLWRAAGELGLGPDAARAAEEAGLIEVGARVRFRHPLVRAAAYRLASPDDRREAHRALVAVTDPERDADRRAWHRAHATALPDEQIAAELECSAHRAQQRGGLAAAGARLERAAQLTPDPVRRAQRELAAARVKRDAGALDAALGLLASVEAGPPDALRAAEVEHLRGRIAFDQRRASDAARLLLDAARRLDPLDADLARETYLEALSAAMWASGPGAPDVLSQAAEAARAAPPAREPPREIDVVLDALATRFTEGYATAAPLLTRALEIVQNLGTEDGEAARTGWVVGNRASGIIATEVWDFDSGRLFGERQVQTARDTGALVQLQFALNYLALNQLLAGELAAAALLIEEDRTAAEATGNAPVAYAGMLLGALRGHEEVASRLIAPARRDASTRGQGRIVTFADYASAVLFNGLGRHDEARDAARRVFEHDVVGGYQTLVTAELAEAASRTGEPALVLAAIDRMSERTRATPTEWALGIEARLKALLQALLSHDEEADVLYRKSIEHLSRTAIRVELARGHLLYGEWLRRNGRRIDARDQLRKAHDMLAAMGLDGFSERARRELAATGENARKRTYETRGQLTPQEEQIAQLARDGLSNPEIGTRLFLSPRTVEWHLRKVFTKLGVASRKELRRALPSPGRAIEVA